MFISRRRRRVDDMYFVYASVSVCVLHPFTFDHLDFLVRKYVNVSLKYWRIIGFFLKIIRKTDFVRVHTHTHTHSPRQYVWNKSLNENLLVDFNFRIFYHPKLMLWHWLPDTENYIDFSISGSFSLSISPCLSFSLGPEIMLISRISLYFDLMLEYCVSHSKTHMFFVVVKVSRILTFSDFIILKWVV